MIPYDGRHPSVSSLLIILKKNSYNSRKRFELSEVEKDGSEGTKPSLAKKFQDAVSKKKYRCKS